MIRLKMNYMNHSIELQLPTDYEHVLVALWKLGLKRDPGKYTLSELSAVFQYDTPMEHQMIRLIDSGNTLLFALRSLHEMMTPPPAIADQLRRKIWEGHYNTADEYYLDLEKLVFGRDLRQTYYLFPISGQLLDKAGNGKRAPLDTMMDYEDLISQAISDVVFQSLSWDSELFSDVEGAYQKIMSAGWSVENIEGMLYGHVTVFHTEPFTEEEYADVAEKIEMFNATEFAIRLKQWSVLTDDGLLFVYLCDEDGDYSVFNSDLREDDADGDDEPCMCPECQELMRKGSASAGAVLDNEELEE